MLTLSIKHILTQTGIRFFSKTTMAFQQPIHVAVVGVGLVGSEFMRQLLSLPPPSPFRVISLSSSTRTLFLGKDNAITPGNTWDWKAMLATSPTPSDLWLLTAQLSALVQANERIALVDNTSSDEVASFYPTWLRSGINIVTPNKKAFSGEAELYDEIVMACTETGTKCLYEATVGAGLPIIAPLKEILATGDKVRYVYLFVIIQKFTCK
jgi:homoserine dehydrogenase